MPLGAAFFLCYGNRDSKILAFPNAERRCGGFLMMSSLTGLPSMPTRPATRSPCRLGMAWLTRRPSIAKSLCEAGWRRRPALAGAFIL